MDVAVALLAMLLALLPLALLLLPSLLLAPLPLMPLLFLDSPLPCVASFSALAAVRFAASARAASFAALAAVRFATSAPTDLVATQFASSARTDLALLHDPPLLTTPLPLMLVRLLFPFGTELLASHL